jgi:small subunit ribosomal protein S6
MKKYELMFIVKPTLSEEDIKKVAESFKKTLELNGSKVTSTDEWGQKALAYDMKKGSETYKSGYYFVYEVEAEDEKGVKEFDRLARISADVIRSLVTRKED